MGFRPGPLADSYGYAAYPSEPPQPQPVEDEYQFHELEFSSPALGDGFNFNVTARCTWHGTASVLDLERLRKEIVNRRREIAGELQAAVRTITRQHAPQACAEVERSINDELPYSWPVDGVGKITCKVQALVEPDAAIRDAQRRTGLRSIEVAHEYEETRRRVHRLRDDVALWRELLEEWPGDRTTTDAIVLTLRPGELETIVSRPRVTVDSERQRLIAEASRWLEGIRERGLEEALFGFDSALLRLLEHLGIPPSSRTTIGDANGQQWDGRQDGETEGGQQESGPSDEHS